MRTRPGLLRPPLAGLLLAAALAACSDAEPTPGEGITVERTPSAIRLSSPSTVLDVLRDPLRLELRAARGEAALAAHAPGGGPYWERGGVEHRLGGVLSDRTLPDGVELVVATTEGHPARVSVRFLGSRTIEVLVEPPSPFTIEALGDRWHSPPDERIYGLTERLRDAPLLVPGVIDVPREDVFPAEAGTLDRRGEQVEMFVRPTIAIYAPFFHGSRGWGLSVAGTAAGAFDVARSDPTLVSYRFETGNAPESHTLRFHLFHGPGHDVIVDEYTRLTGRPFVPPDWAFLHWRWRGELRVGEPAVVDGTPINADVAEDVLMYERLGIPPGVYVLDRPVLDGEFGFARFAWDEERLPNVGAMLAALARRGYRVLTWSSMWACGSRPGDNGSEALRLGFLAPGVGTPRCADVGGNSFILDATSAGAREWWRERVRDFVAAHGIRGIKLDRGEEHLPDAATDVWADGRHGREVRNAYPTLQAQVHHDAMQEAFPHDALVITRSGYTGTQRWAIVWGGDTAGSENFGSGAGTDLGLRSAIISQQRVAFLGYPIWGSDTGGYYEFKDRDVFARWLELSAFSGIMEIGGVGAHAPWAMPTEPAYDEQLIAIYRRYTRLREALQPYLVAAAGEARVSGMPLVRPLVFAWPDDPAVADRWDEYLLGPDLLIAPVWRTGERAREVYLPRGEWRSYWDPSLRYQGPLTVTVAAPLELIPVFVRGDAQVPAEP
ncbi:MAG: TIM-barrel domain-containing protein [Thermodesulfobacteriota bacterium]